MKLVFVSAIFFFTMMSVCPAQGLDRSNEEKILRIYNALLGKVKNSVSSKEKAANIFLKPSNDNLRINAACVISYQMYVRGMLPQISEKQRKELALMRADEAQDRMNELLRHSFNLREASGGGEKFDAKLKIPNDEAKVYFTEQKPDGMVSLRTENVLDWMFSCNGLLAVLN
jgi:hypothetical protein